jgi:aspartyl-tRNA(Asn)/glutamyl-tRNA(Gln) amidotransferase subunit B
MPEIGDYQPTIGLEVHVQLDTRTKMFCACESVFGAEPNSRTCPTCLGLPGSLPVLNSEVIEKAVKTILATGGQVHEISIFARKNYFYPDLPKGYQISQYDRPIGTGGTVEYKTREGELKQCSLTRIHIEEDAGKLLHPEAGEEFSRVDLNRCGLPLLEIVTEPVLSTPAEAASYLIALKQLLQYLQVSHADMEKGELRCDANVSVRRSDSNQLGVRTEIKNMNSFRAVERALETEIQRQIKLLKSGESVEQATLLWNESSQDVELMRSKEESEDYRYFPEPDLPQATVSELQIEAARQSLPEIPSDKVRRFVAQYGIREGEAELLSATRDLAGYFEAVASQATNYSLVVNWIATELLGQLHQRHESISDCRVKPDRLADLVNRVESGEVSGKIAKTVLSEMVETGANALTIIESQQLTQISDRKALLNVVEKVLARNSESVRQFRNGKVKVLSHLVGEVMKETGGRANPVIVNEILKSKLSE